jgi:hypothetical protein
VSLSDAFDVARLAETVLDGKQPIAPILASGASAVAEAQLAMSHAQSALAHLAKALAGLQALNDELQAARGPAR